MKFSFFLRPHQREAVGAMIKNKEGIIALSTGQGKSLCALETVKSLGVTSLILVDRQALMYQMAEEAKHFYGIETGLIGDGKEIYNPRLTIAIFQTLDSRKSLLDYLANEISCLIIDECHTIVSKQRKRVLEKFHPTYLYGMTASVMRSDGQEKAISFYLGDILYEYVHTAYTPSVEIIHSFSEIPLDEYGRMVENLVQNKERNALIADLAQREIRKKRQTLILVKRKEHANILYERLKQLSGVFQIRSDDKKRFSFLSSLKKNTIPFSVLIGTTSLLSQGVDIPSLSSLIIACDMRAELLVMQSAGRILRLFEGKKDPLIIDLIDADNPVFRRHGVIRKRFYEKQGWGLSIDKI